MRIHSKKIKEDFDSYFTDLEKSVLDSLRKHKKGETPSIFKEVYPLFVMLETISSPDYFLDPSKQIELDQCIEIGDKKRIVNARRALLRTVISDELRMGLENQIFTPYFDELYSDVLLLMNQYYLNNYRGCYLYVRCILEDVYKHIYYLDHRQEFYMATSGKSEHDLMITPQYLRDYLEKTSYLCDLRTFNSALEKLDKEKAEQNRETIFNLNANLYRKASAFVHPSGRTFMSHFTSNSDLVYDEESARKILKITKEVVNMTIIFLICVHFQQFSRFNEYEKNLVISGFDETTKRNLRTNLGI